MQGGNAKKSQKKISFEKKMKKVTKKNHFRAFIFQISGYYYSIRSPA